ncbi:hypothetical protein [Glycomyces sp. MUSA5-2]|uniref:hypothetical protein n=1 Tax=Glycomyces sp. MUSA5-2 TaxID=2053002 RepID=UPI003008997B
MRREPFTTIERAFGKLVAADALTVDASLHPGLPNRPLPISEVVTFLQDPASPRPACDRIWRVLLTAPDRQQWDLVCLGLALPALRKAAARADRIWPYDPDGIQAEALDAFIRELHQPKIPEERIFSTICIRVKTACRTFARELARHARGPSETVFESQTPASPWTHIDLVLVRAVEQEIISKDEAIQIAMFRLEGIPDATIAEAMSASRKESRLARKIAEHKLAKWIVDYS